MPLPWQQATASSTLSQHTHTQWDVIGRTNKIKHHSVNRFKTELEILKQILHLNNWPFTYCGNLSQRLRNFINYLQNLKLISVVQGMSGLLFAYCAKILDFLVVGKTARSSNKYSYWNTFLFCSTHIKTSKHGLNITPDRLHSLFVVQLYCGTTV